MTEAMKAHQRIIREQRAAEGTDEDLFGAWWLGVETDLKALTEDLFPPQHVRHALPTNTAEVEVSLEELGALPDSLVPALEARQIDDLAQIEMEEAVKRALSVLTPREELVVRWRFGFLGEIPTLEVCGQRLGVQRERIRQLEAKALRRLKHPSRSNALREFY